MTVRIWSNPRTRSNLNCLFSMHNWKWVNLSKMAGFNISLSLMKSKVAGTKSTTKAYVRSRSVYPFPLFICRLSTVFSIDSETNETIPLHFQNVFHFFSEKNSLSKTFLVECVRSGAASCNKRREFWRETYTPLWLLIGRIIFFTSENHRSLLWLARINLRTKIYDVAVWWAFLSMYIIISYIS